ncbi:MAG: S-layer homology domain-containing protein [Clostridiales bacterium]|nr:S-layer homology domain-containing protein [Clostridiales bacterium]
MKKIIKLISFLTAFSLLGINVSATEIPYLIKYDYLSQKMTVSGDCDANDSFITIQIINGDESFESFDYSKLLYGGQCRVKDGKYSFDIDYDAGKGIYKGRLAHSKDLEKTDFDVVIISAEELKTIYDAIDEAVKNNDISAFEGVIDENIIYLSADKNAGGDFKKTDLFEYAKKNGFDYTQSEKNIDIFNSFLIFDKLNDGMISNINPQINKLYLEDSYLLEAYEGICKNESTRQYFTQKLSLREIHDIDKFVKTFKEALVLTYAKHASGYGELRTVLTKYGADLGISVSSNADIYKNLVGQDYGNISTFISAYNNAANNTQSTVSGGTGGGGGGGTSPNIHVTGSTGNVSETKDIPPEINITFEDIEGVDWAVEAIVALADKGIIDGKDNNKFKPYDKITREEFVKILVGAMNLSDASYSGNVFEDVDESDWFCRYVNIAYKNNIVQGTGEGKFGTGAKITRQDMAVMLYNALLTKGTTANTAEPAFEDNSLIADYAKTAVGTLYGMGVIDGVSDTKFDPLANATRAQAAKIIYAVLKQLQ